MKYEKQERALVGVILANEAGELITQAKQYMGTMSALDKSDIRRPVYSTVIRSLLERSVRLSKIAEGIA